jgi:beta-phosphoglucomutase-like phosphatase (HAD superfamily)
MIKYSQNSQDSLNILNKSLFIFDFDGVLVDSNNIKSIAFAKIYDSYGANVVRKVVQHHSENGGMSREDKFKLYHDKFLKLEIMDSEILNLSEKFTNLVLEEVMQCSEIEGVTEILNYCMEQGIICAIASASPEVELKKIISLRPWSNVFKYKFGSPESKVSNINKILNITSIPKNKAIFFGDSSNDLDAAKKCQIDFIGINFNSSDMTGFRELLNNEGLV